MSEMMDEIEAVRTHMMLHASQHRFPLETCCAIVNIEVTREYWEKKHKAELAEKMQELSEFYFLRIAYDLSGYYVERWDRAVPVSVIAKTEVEARQKIFAISPELERPWSWKARLTKVTPVSELEKVGGE